ncbi:MAG: FKBP-type 22 kDa peptidyl-prolyl cis-trans isomerase [Formosa sp. Hel1_33_131]|jgi:hypothetical protein|nr:MAG: FKBP-type 22 kDa peptidyl-prolyl cis-trans isomerase [Formosa sp. Hel1_33_131]|tara:strand:+ start:1691 stop:2728 length:1038 start_codon:yes stop_codon:yes gene_type:complete
MKFNYNILFISLMIVAVMSCDDDDNGGDVPAIVENDRTEQQVIDGDALLSYLSTHYYNSSEINVLENPTVDDLVFTTLLEGETVPSDATLLSSVVETKTTTYKEVDYKYYILKINQGSGASSPVFSDKVRVNYSGSLEDGTMFDSSSSPVNFDLVYVVAGWNRVMPEFNAASSFESNPDGTVDFSDYGMGAMFLPSGLGYYADFLPSIPSYSNLIFKFELIQTEVNDHDGDYVSSYLEDINGDFDLFNDDTDGDLTPDFADTDDDGDGTNTANEVEVKEYTNESLADLKNEIQEVLLNENQFFTAIKQKRNDDSYYAHLVTLVDTNGNGIPNYLDATESETQMVN